MNNRKLWEKGDIFECPEGCPAFHTTRKPAYCPHCGRSLEGEVFIIE
jgi:hypothetical protein